MSIWTYEERKTAVLRVTKLLNESDCVFCATELHRDQAEETEAISSVVMHRSMSGKFEANAHANIGVCPACGWWKYTVCFSRPRALTFVVRIGSLKELDLTDISLPMQAVRAYLTANYESRFDVHPRVFEEVVAAVFKDHGYESRATAYSGDGGIDVILSEKNGSTVGVQVKRHKDRICIAQIRELTGALVIGGHTRGIFVTTSEFQSGAAATAQKSAECGYPIELVDATAFLHILKVAQLASYQDVFERKPWGNVRGC